MLYLSYFYTTREREILSSCILRVPRDILRSADSPCLVLGFKLHNRDGQRFSGHRHPSLRSGNRAGWRYLFLIEGLVTLAVGLISYFLMPPGPTQTKAWFRPKGWFTEREEVIMVDRSAGLFLF